MPGDPIIKRAGMPLTGLIRPHFCACHMYNINKTKRHTSRIVNHKAFIIRYMYLSNGTLFHDLTYWRRKLLTITPPMRFAVIGYLPQALWYFLLPNIVWINSVFQSLSSEVPISVILIWSCELHTRVKTPILTKYLNQISKTKLAKNF